MIVASGQSLLVISNLLCFMFHNVSISKNASIAQAVIHGLCQSACRGFGRMAPRALLLAVAADCPQPNGCFDVIMTDPGALRAVRNLDLSHIQHCTISTAFPRMNSLPLSTNLLNSKFEPQSILTVSSQSSSCSIKIQTRAHSSPCQRDHAEV